MIEPFDSAAFRQALSGFATGVAVASGLRPDGVYAGVTINSFSSVSLDPPLVLFSLERSSPSLAAFGVGAPYAIMILAQDQMHWSRHFASSAQEKWAGVPHQILGNGCPALEGTVAEFSGSVVARHDGGDHDILLCRVNAIRRDPAREPLLYFNSRYARLRTE